MAGRPGFPESPGRFYRGSGHAIQTAQLCSETAVGRTEAGGRLYGCYGRVDIVEHPVHAVKRRQPGALGIGAGRQPLERRWGFFGIYGVEPQLGGSIPVVRFVANP